MYHLKPKANSPLGSSTAYQYSTNTTASGGAHKKQLFSQRDSKQVMDTSSNNSSKLGGIKSTTNTFKKTRNSAQA